MEKFPVTSRQGLARCFLWTVNMTIFFVQPLHFCIPRSFFPKGWEKSDRWQTFALVASPSLSHATIQCHLETFKTALHNMSRSCAIQCCGGRGGGRGGRWSNELWHLSWPFFVVKLGFLCIWFITNRLLDTSSSDVWWGVKPGSLNPAPISHQNIKFSKTSFPTWPLNPNPFSGFLAWPLNDTRL